MRSGFNVAAMLAGAFSAVVITTAAAAGTGSSPCEAAATQAEQHFSLPAGLLQAIGHVESGRHVAGSGGVVSWPWALNVEGESRFPETLGDALTEVRTLQAQGHRSIDVGCFQMNLVYHGSEFSSLEEAFDPEQNALHAAAFLSALQTRYGSWEEAVGRYHSAATERAYPYRSLVYQSWGEPAGTMPSTMPVFVAARPLSPEEIRIIRSAPVSHVSGMRIWTPEVNPSGAGVRVIEIKGNALPVVNTPTVNVHYW